MAIIHYNTGSAGLPTTPGSNNAAESIAPDSDDAVDSITPGSDNAAEPIAPGSDNNRRNEPIINIHTLPILPVVIQEYLFYHYGHHSFYLLLNTFL